MNEACGGIQKTLECAEAKWREYNADRIAGLKPPILYHYTTAEGLCGILESRQLHATHTSHLDDPSEVDTGLQVLR
jgi:hypothetical protein